MLVYAVRNLVPSAPPMVARLVALAVGLGTWTVAGYAVTAGYVDHLWAAALAARSCCCSSVARSSAPVRVGRPMAEDVSRRPHLPLAVVLMTVAALTKNEGFVAALIVAVAVHGPGPSPAAVAAWVWTPVPPGSSWSVIARAFGATSDLADSPRVEQLPAR